MGASRERKNKFISVRRESNEKENNMAEASDSGKGALDVEVEETCGMCLRKVHRPRLTVLECMHPFHTGCITGWLGVARSCPRCKVALARADIGEVEGCPVRGCKPTAKVLTANEWVAHARVHHKIVRCRTCKAVYMKHMSAHHLGLDCARSMVKCPAEGCSILMNATLAVAGEKDQKIIREDHDCGGLYSCSTCGTPFLSTEALKAHVLVCEGRGMLVRKKRKSAVACDVLFEKVRRLEQTGILEGYAANAVGGKYLADALEVMPKLVEIVGIMTKRSQGKPVTQKDIKSFTGFDLGQDYYLMKELRDHPGVSWDKKKKSYVFG